VSLYLNDPADGDDGSEICDGEESRAISPPRIRRPCRASPAVSVEQKAPGNLEPEAWATLRRVLDLVEACKVEGVEVGSRGRPDHRSRCGEQS